MSPTTLLTAPHVLAAEPSPKPSPSCVDSDLCTFIWRETGNAWLADGSYVLLVKPLTILTIILVAVVLRWLINRTIRRVVAQASDDSPSVLLRPLRDRIPKGLREATVQGSERRRQRAAALGSVLRSVSSAVIFAVATLMILGELGFNLAPLIASAGIAGIAIGFGAQNLVKDFIAGMFMLFEDQYGVGDVVDFGEATGTVEAVGLRVTTVRDANGVLWYIRNGEIVRVGNKSQGWAMVVVDVPVGYAPVQEAVEVLRRAAAEMADDPTWREELSEPPEVLGVEQITVDGAILRTTAKTASDAQWRVGRELRRRLTEALDRAGITARLRADRMYPLTRDAPATETGQAGPT